MIIATTGFNIVVEGKYRRNYNIPELKANNSPKACL